MVAQKSFVIDRVEWHTRRGESSNEIAVVHKYFRNLIAFLQDNGLTVRTILRPSQAVTDDTQVSSSDLTDEGMSLMKRYFEKWLSRIDHGMSPSDLTILTQGLVKLREEK